MSECVCVWGNKNDSEEREISINLFFSTGNSQSIWLDAVYCPSSIYNCIANCAGCASVEYHNCGHRDVTIECST